MGPSREVGAMTDCLFCKIASGGVEADVVAQTERLLAFRDIDPKAPTHVLIIPREHIKDLTEVTPEHGDLMAEVALLARQVAAEDGIDEGGYRLVANVGPDAGQSVLHLHFHVIGGRSLSWPPG